MSLTANAFFFMIVLSFIGIIWWFTRCSFGKFLDKVFSFPLLREGGSYKYKNFQEEFTYQGQAIYTGFAGVILAISVFFSFGLNWVGWALFSPFFLSFIFFLRIGTFNDDNISPETGIGYDVTKSWTLSLIGSIGLSVIFFVLNISDNLILPIIALFLILIAGLIPIFPDYINNFLSYDIRSERGELFLERITWIFIVISWAFLFASIGLIL
nr:hypothetical protein [Methanobrevibacter arboriphilus]